MGRVRVEIRMEVARHRYSERKRRGERGPAEWPFRHEVNDIGPAGGPAAKQERLRGVGRINIRLQFGWTEGEGRGGIVTCAPTDIGAPDARTRRHWDVCRWTCTGT